MEMKQAYHQKMAAQLAQWGAEIDLLQAKAVNAGADLRIQYNEDLQALKEKRELASAQLESLKEASNDAWAQIKETADTMWDELKQGITDAHSKLTK